MSPLVSATLAAGAVVAAGLPLAYACALTRKCIRAMPAEEGARADALFDLSRRTGNGPMLSAAAVVLAWKLIELSLGAQYPPWDFTLGWTMLTLLTVANVWVVSEAQVALRPEEWSRRTYVLGAAMTVAMWFGPPLVMGWMVPFVRLGIPDDPSGPDPAVPLSFVAGLLLAGACMQRFGPTHLPGPELRAELTAALAEKAGGPVPRVRTADTRASGLVNAYAYRRRGREEIVISAELVEQLTTSEVVAILLHEVGHHRLRHIRNRNWVLRIGWIAVALVPAALGSSSLYLVACLHTVLLTVILPQSWQRQEIEADRFAAERCGAEVTGSALRKLNRALLMPATFGPRERRTTHPGLARRLAALGVDGAATTAT